MSHQHSFVGLMVGVCLHLLLAAPAFPIADPTPLPLDELLGIVRVDTARGRCTGMVIGSKTILTAAQCACTEHWVGGNDCVARADVTFRDDPHMPVFFQQQISGTVTVHPDYNPSWTEAQIEHDLAMITLDGVSPAHATPLIVAGGFLAKGSTVMTVGQGKTGRNCNDGNGAFANFALARLDDYEDGHDIIRFDKMVFCPGDSGGAILDETGSRLHGVISMINTLTGSEKAVTTASEFNWIKAHTCCDSKDRSDILWRCVPQAPATACGNAVAGSTAIWHDANPGETSWPGAVDFTWQIHGVGDFNHDGKSDILWRSAHGDNVIWPGGQAPGYWLGPLGGEWQVVGIGDFDGAGQSDILWRCVPQAPATACGNAVAGSIAIWHDANPEWTSWPGALDFTWRIQGAGKFD
jgi:hypothetical protein